MLAAVCLLGCAKTVTAYTDTSLEAGFDTVFSYTEYTDSRDTFTAHFESSVNAAKTLSGLFDIYGDENYDYEKILKESIISCKIR